ncbi:hypothetical protein IWQ60_000272 [Tieghemiomyces parasiticus]|uniref:EXPERA domain-containing protein n=1 Tax=Tieghemiomyces parasiticus TaxID=78921 RepID=A0A9W8AIV4_9FUNG|nr:hypothetical protein IWQ60_000272 [Tieghemiomyces parasiticus]
MDTVLETVLPAHPYYPTTLALPHYVANTLTFQQALGVLGAAILVIGTGATVLLSRRPQLSACERIVFIWFLVSGSIHLFLEGYFVLNHRTLAGDQGILGQLWKEYSHSDSRYLSSDTFVLLMEAVTAIIDGPLCYLAAFAIYQNSPFRHVVQLSVSIAQLYGDLLYYTTTLFEGFPHCNPHPFYFWFYFVFMNAVWIVIPFSLAWQSGKYLTSAVARIQALESRKKAH